MLLFKMKKEFELDVFESCELFDPAILDSFEFGIGERKVSAVIPTYNRCPYRPEQSAKNPLVWCRICLCSVALVMKFLETQSFEKTGFF